MTYNHIINSVTLSYLKFRFNIAQTCVSKGDMKWV